MTRRIGGKMTNEEREQKIRAEKVRHNKALNDIDVEFALSNNRVQLGDIVSDGFSIVLVDRIENLRDTPIPSCVYYGIKLKKDLTLRADRARESVWQGRIKMHLRGGKEVEIDGIKE
jgi:hypothetical protein